MKTISQKTSWLGLLLLTVAAPCTAIAAPTLPVPRHDTLQDYQIACSQANGFTSLSMQVSCIKSLVNESTDSFVNKDDPDTQLYLLTAEKLADDVNNKQITVATARVNLQRAMIEVESKHRSEREAMQAKVDAERREQVIENERAVAAQRALMIQEQAEAQQRQQTQAMIMQANQQRENTIEFCVAQVQARQRQYLAGTNQSSSYSLGQSLGMALTGNTPRSMCERNPQFYQTMPAAPVVTKCERNAFGATAELTCTTN